MPRLSYILHIFVTFLTLLTFTIHIFTVSKVSTLITKGHHWRNERRIQVVCQDYVALNSLASGFAVGIVGDAGVRAVSQSQTIRRYGFGYDFHRGHWFVWFDHCSCIGNIINAECCNIFL